MGYRERAFVKLKRDFVVCFVHSKRFITYLSAKTIIIVKSV